MKMTLNEALILNDIVKALIDNTNLKITPIFKFKLLGIAKNLEMPVANYQMIREEKIREYGSESVDAEGNPTGGVEIKPEDIESITKFTKDMNDFINTEIEVDIQKLKVQEVFDAGVPSDYLVRLFNIIEE